MDNAPDKYNLCLKITSDALDKMNVISDDEQTARLVELIKGYYNDAKYYADKGMIATALEAIAYAHGLLDGGILLGVIDIPGYHLKED